MSEIYCGIDFHKNTSMVIAVNDKGEKVVQDNIKSANLKTYFSSTQKAGWKIAIEATGGSNHVAQMLRDLNLSVTLINPNQFRGIGIGGKKTDERDALALANGLRMGFAPAVHLKTLQSRQLKTLLTSREILVRHRCSLMNHIRGTLREYGVVFPAGAEEFYMNAEEKVKSLTDGMIREFLLTQVTEVKRLLAQEKKLEADLESTYGQDDRIKRLRSIPGVGPMVSLSMLAIVDGDIDRFPNASCFAAFLGLVPSVSASANKRMMGSITRSGPEMLRRYLIHGARAWMRYSAENGDKNRKWAEQVKGRRGQNKAVVALAHRIARICYAVLRDGTYYSFPKKPSRTVQDSPENPVKQEGQAA